MTVQIKATNIELTEAIKEYVNQKIDMLQKFVSSENARGAVRVHMEVERTTDHHKKGNIFRAELQMQVNGVLLRVEKSTDDLYKAIDKVKDEMARQLSRRKDKVISGRKNGADVDVSNLA